MSASTTGAAPRVAPGAPDDRSPGARRPSALLVEDDLDQRVLLTRLLQKAGYTVHAVATATEALAIPGTAAGKPGSPTATQMSEGGEEVAVDPVRIILLDLRLPDLGGWELLARLRERHPGCPVVVCSVLDVEDYPDADGVLPKPVTSAALRQVLAELDPRGEAG